MIRYTTPTITLVVEGVELNSEDIYVTLKQGALEMTKSGDDLDISVDEDTTIQFSLSQEESAEFKENLSVAVQVNWIASNGTRAATSIQNISVFKNLLDEVIEYGN